MATKSKSNLQQFRTQRRNTNKHTQKGLQALSQSITRDGFIGAITVAADGEAFDGSARLQTVNEVLPNDPIIVEADGTRPIIVKRIDIATADDPKAKRLAVGANVIARLDFDPDAGLLAELAKDDSLITDLLKEDAEFAKLVREPKIEMVNASELIDKAEELQKKWKVQRGDVWQIGRHRLMCGDSTSAEDVATLMGGELADSLITDPPYGVDYSSKNEFLNKADKGNRVQSPIENDNIEDYRTFFNAFLAIVPFADYNTIYVFSNDPHLHDVRLSFEDCGFVFTTYIAWVKNNHVLGRKDYNGKHEHIAYGWRGKHKFYGGFATSVLEIDKPMRSELHPTTKPTELISKLVGDGSPNGGIVYDAFTGSGTTLVACEQTGRIGRGMEIEPKYCAVTLERLSLLGLTCERVNG